MHRAPSSSFGPAFSAVGGSGSYFRSYRRNVVEMVQQRVTNVLTEEGEQSVSELQSALETPYPPASSPGEYPHRRTGNLQSGIESQVHTDQYDVELTVASSRINGNPHVPSFLEFGTSRMAPRPYMRPARIRTQARLLNELADALKV